MPGSTSPPINREKLHDATPSKVVMFVLFADSRLDRQRQCSRRARATGGRPTRGKRRQAGRGCADERLHRGSGRRPRGKSVFLAREDRDQGDPRRQGIDLGRDRLAQRPQDPGRRHASDLRRQPSRSSCTSRLTGNELKPAATESDGKPLRGPERPDARPAFRRRLLHRPGQFGRQKPGRHDPLP